MSEVYRAARIDDGRRRRSRCCTTISSRRSSSYAAFSARPRSSCRALDACRAPCSRSALRGDRRLARVHRDGAARGHDLAFELRRDRRSRRARHRAGRAGGPRAHRSGGVRDWCIAISSRRTCSAPAAIETCGRCSTSVSSKLARSGTLTRRQRRRHARLHGARAGARRRRRADGRRVRARGHRLSRAHRAARVLRARLPRVLFDVCYVQPMQPSKLVALPDDVERVLRSGWRRIPRSASPPRAQLAAALRAAFEGGLDAAFRQRADSLLARAPWGARLTSS